MIQVKLSEQETVDVLNALSELPYKMVRNLIGFFEYRLNQAKEADKADKKEQRDNLGKGGKAKTVPISPEESK